MQSRKDAFIVLSNGSHARGRLYPAFHQRTLRSRNDPDLWIGLEQEYFLYQDGRPLGFPENGYPTTPQGPYYCGVGYKNMEQPGPSNLVRRAPLELCLCRWDPIMRASNSLKSRRRSVGVPDFRQEALPKPLTTLGPLAI